MTIPSNPCKTRGPKSPAGARARARARFRFARARARRDSRAGANVCDLTCAEARTPVGRPRGNGAALRAAAFSPRAEQKSNEFTVIKKEKKKNIQYYVRAVQIRTMMASNKNQMKFKKKTFRSTTYCTYCTEVAKSIVALARRIYARLKIVPARAAWPGRPVLSGLLIPAGVRKCSMSSPERTWRPGQAARAGTIFSRA